MTPKLTHDTLFKFLTEDNLAPYTNAKWHLPKGNKPAKWMPEIEGDLLPCENGYHLITAKDVFEWHTANLYVAEHKGELVESSNKVVVRQARLLRRVETWNKRTLALWACDCAEQALNTIENPDPRSVEAIRIARLYMASESTLEALQAAAYAADAAADAAAAAYAADAAAAAAAAAAYAADAAAAAADAAAAAYAADAAAAAAAAAAYAADAAAAAADAAAAAYAAADAAAYAAYAAYAAAYAAYAAHEWQIERLLMYLNGEL